MPDFGYTSIPQTFWRCLWNLPKKILTPKVHQRFEQNVSFLSMHFAKALFG